MAETGPRFVSALAGIVAPGRCGRTDIAPGGVVSELPAAGLAGSFWDWLAASAAEYGMELVPPPASPLPKG